MARKLYYVWSNGKDSRIFDGWPALSEHMAKNGGKYWERWEYYNYGNSGSTLRSLNIGIPRIKI